MRVSLRWLKEYIDIRESALDLAERLTMAGLEVESVENPGDRYKGFVVGEVLSVEKHPAADRLTVCRVNAGGEALQIVCGAPNVRPSQKVAVALVGAVVPRDQHDPAGKPFEVSRIAIRGVESRGMICSAYELDLGGDRDGIVVLDPDLRPGLPFAEHLGLNDTVLDIAITPNRPDAMSHIGIAREIGAFSGRKLKLPAVKLKESTMPSTKLAKVVVEDPEGCPRYTARVIRGVTIAPSPKWLQDKLAVIGVRPVNNVVDISNYVLMECGHPLHAFDYDRLEGGTIVVKLAKEGDRFTTLDHKERVLRADTLMICDARRPVAIAGVMGGANTEISDSTTTVLLESAYFDPRSIRRTSKHFGLSTEASQRFERGADPSITQWAADRAAKLIQETSGGEILKKAIDVYPRKISERTVEVRAARANEILGLSLSSKEIISLLSRLRLTPVKSRRKGHLGFRVPPSRPDLEREIDLVEEIARVHGYNNIDTKMISTIKFHDRAPAADLADELRRILTGAGMMEMVANSMQDLQVASLSGESIVRIANPVSKDMAALRTSMIPGTLAIVRDNIFHGTKDLRLYEIGKIYRNDPHSRKGPVPGYIEENRLIIAMTGSAAPLTWDGPQRAVDLFDLRGELQALCDTILLDKIKFIPYSTTKALTEKGLTLEINGEYGGLLGSVRPDLLAGYEIDQPVFVAEVMIDVMEKHKGGVKEFHPLSKYPSVMRDLAVVVREETPLEDLERLMRESGGPLMRRIELFDVYRGDQIEKGNKSCAFALEFMAEDHTLEQEEVDRIMQKITRRVAQDLNASIRK